MLPFFTTISALIALYLVWSDYLIDTLDLLKDNSYKGSGAAIILFDRDFYYLEANEAAQKLFPEEFEAIDKKKISSRQMLIIKNMLEGSFEREFEHQGQYYYAFIEKCMMHNKVRGYVVVLTNVTVQREDAHLMEALKNLSEENAAKRNQLMANLTHDLKSPLNSIIGISDILMDKHTTMKEDKYLLANIKQAGKALLVLVNDLLNFSKIDSNHLKIEDKEYNFESMVNDVACINLFNLKEKPVNFQVNFNTPYPVNVVGDELRVREIIQNLLSNAVKFTEQGSIVCEINCTTKDDDVCVEVKVKDTGRGMTEVQLKSIFSTYVSFAGNYSQEGSGLGLVIVKQLSEMMGGTAYAESDGVSGSTFVASFHQKLVGDDVKPPVVLNSKDLIHGYSVERKDEIPSYVFPTANVLLVDDLVINQEIFRTLTLPWQFNVDHAESGARAIELVKGKEYDLVILDYMMPGMNGADTLKGIREISGVPVVLMSANITENEKERYKKRGFDDSLSKPFNLSDVKRVLESILPEEKRAPYINTNKPQAGTFAEDGPSSKALLIFAKELREIMSNLFTIYEEDLDLFRVKVHGVKGAARQFGYIDLSEKYEVLEMAAKTENRKYIERHLLDYINYGKEISSEIESLAIEKMQNAMETEQQGVETTVALTREEIEDAWKELANGFEGYDADLIEEKIAILESGTKAGSLSEKEVELLMLVVEDYHKLDYEAGLSKLQEQGK